MWSSMTDPSVPLRGGTLKMPHMLRFKDIVRAITTIWCHFITFYFEALEMFELFGFITGMHRAALFSTLLSSLKCEKGI